MDWREDDDSLGTEGSETSSDNWQVWFTYRFPAIIPVCLGGRSEIQKKQYRALTFPLCQHFLTWKTKALYKLTLSLCGLVLEVSLGL